MTRVALWLSLTAATILLFPVALSIARTGHEWAVPLLAILAMIAAAWIVERHHQGGRR